MKGQKCRCHFIRRSSYRERRAGVWSHPTTIYTLEENAYRRMLWVEWMMSSGKVSSLSPCRICAHIRDYDIPPMKLFLWTLYYCLWMHCQLLFLIFRSRNGEWWDEDNEISLATVWTVLDVIFRHVVWKTLSSSFSKSCCSFTRNSSTLMQKTSSTWRKLYPHREAINIQIMNPGFVENSNPFKWMALHGRDREKKVLQMLKSGVQPVPRLQNWWNAWAPFFARIRVCRSRGAHVERCLSQCLIPRKTQESLKLFIFRVMFHTRTSAATIAKTSFLLASEPSSYVEWSEKVASHR